MQKKYIKNIEEQNLFYNQLPKQIKTSSSAFLESLEKEEKKLAREKSLQEDLKRKEKLELLRNRELEIIRTRKSKIDNLLKIKHPKYIAKKDYITAEENEQKRKREEEALIKIEIKKRKLRLQPINSAELNKFSKEVQKNEKMIMKELGQKKAQMRQIWQERKSLLPEYRSKFMEQNMENEIKLKEEMILKQERIKKEKNIKNKFKLNIKRLKEKIQRSKSCDINLDISKSKSKEKQNKKNNNMSHRLTESKSKSKKSKNKINKSIDDLNKKFKK